MHQTLKNIKIGNTNSTSVAVIDGPGCRPKAQLDAICRYHKEFPSTWWCINPFEVEPNGKKYHYTFWHSYFGIDGEFHVISVTPTGRIKTTPKRDDKDPHSFKKETDAVVKLYGSFQGDMG